MILRCCKCDLSVKFDSLSGLSVLISYKLPSPSYTNMASSDHGACLALCHACNEPIEHDADLEMQQKGGRVEHYHRLCFASMKLVMAVLKFMRRGWARFPHPDYSFITRLLKTVTTAIERLVAHHEEHRAVLVVDGARTRIVAMGDAQSSNEFQSPDEPSGP